MKKQIKKLARSNKQTISNLNSSEMSRVIGGTWYWCSRGGSCKCTQNGNTCPGHKTC